MISARENQLAPLKQLEVQATHTLPKMAVEFLKQGAKLLFKRLYVETQGITLLPISIFTLRIKIGQNCFMVL